MIMDAEPVDALASVPLVVAVERTIAELQPAPKAAGLVTLARLYALAIADAGASQNALKEMGPKLATVLVALGAGKGIEAPLPAAGVPVTPSLIEPTSTGDPVADEVAAMRQRKRGAS
jgi:hypothetical protein